MDAVLGLSMTPTSFGLVLVEGQDADGATMDRSAFDVRHGAIRTSEQATAAVLRTEAVAATRGVRLHSIGLTWSDDAGDQASHLMQSLSESGFVNVVPIRLPEATEALARGMADVIGYETTAVCLVEPEAVITLIVHTGNGAVQTAFNHAIDTEDSLIRWLSTLFTKADWQPQALVMVGSAGGFDDFLPGLEDALSVPVFSPAEAELALARGAALASTVNVDLPFTDVPNVDAERLDGYGSRQQPRAQRRALALLAAGLATFVASASVAVTLELSPAKESLAVRPARSVQEPPAPEARQPVRPVAPAVPAPPEAPMAPPPEVPAVDVAPEPQAPANSGGTEVPPVIVPTFDLPAAVAPTPEPVAAPEAPANTAPVPAQKPTLRSRIMDRLRGVNDGPPQ